LCRVWWRRADTRHQYRGRKWQAAPIQWHILRTSSLAKCLPAADNYLLFKLPTKRHTRTHTQTPVRVYVLHTHTSKKHLPLSKTHTRAPTYAGSSLSLLCLFSRRLSAECSLRFAPSVSLHLVPKSPCPGFRNYSSNFVELRHASAFSLPH